ncbi:11753_t:CDS:2, partial [Diversispora eburnea]
NPSLKSIEFDIKDKSYHIDFGKENIEETIHNVRAVVQAYLPREWEVAKEKKEITLKMNTIIPITLVDINITLSDDINSEVHIDNIEIINNVQQSVGKGDGRNVGQKINHVLVIFSLLNDIEHIFHPENHYTILLYP